MPTKSYKSNLVLGLRGEDGQFFNIGSSVELSEINSPDGGRWDESAGTFEATFDSPFAKLTLADFVLHQFYGYPVEKLLQNNWRRLHGLPMRRRKR